MKIVSIICSLQGDCKNQLKVCAESSSYSTQGLHT